MKYFKVNQSYEMYGFKKKKTTLKSVYTNMRGI